ncbi:MAG TPA: TonB-dependent receptor [Bryobacteraceae bacterium]|nr:TonB-dependent receptor [Bryobacteraceae bacterium]
MRAIILVLAVSMCVYAQEFRATLAGRITDSVGGGVAGAKITIKNADTGEITSTTSGDDGNYQAGFLTPGNYVVTVEKPGFKTSVRSGVTLQVAQRATIEVQLALGEVTQSVTVTGNTALLETESADRGLTVEKDRVLDMPLQGRNPFAAAWSAPGVILTAGAQRLRPFDISGSSSMAINGGRPSSNEVLIDGVTGLYEASSVSYVPTADATSEFRVQNTNYDAEYGWTLGGVINIITKNGTNEFHGAAWEYFQNTHLDANTFNSNRTGVARSSSHINTFGADFSGPIKKNKLFFSYTYEDLRQVIPDPFSTSVPTPLQKQGNFSQTYYSRDASGNPLVQTIYDPFSTTTGSNGTLTRTPFPGNMIPASRLDPVAVKVFSYVPAGNVAGDPLTGLNNLTNSGSTRKFTDFFPENTARVDYNLNESTRLFVRYSRNALQEERSFHYSTTSTINPADTGQNNPFTRENHNATVQFTKTLSPTTVLDVRLGLERFKSESGDEQGNGTGPSALGFSPTFVSQAANWFPKFTWAQYEGAGAQPTYISPIAQTNVVQASLSKVIGRNEMKFGTDLRLLRGYAPVPGYDAGNFSFDAQFTGANPLQIQPSSGNSLASFLLGVPQSGYIQVNSEPARQEKLASLYIQNDIRVTEKLKVNLGLRWDYLGPLTDRFNELPRGFAATTPNPLQAPGFPVKGGVLFAGVNGQPRGIFNSDWKAFGPRAGAAYQLDKRTVLRGGYALVYGQSAGSWYDPGNAPGFSQQTNMVTQIQTGIPANTLDNPFPTGILRPVGSSLGLETALGQTFTFADPAGGHPPFVHQFSFEIQRELPGDFLVSAAYIGSRSRDLPATQQLNALPLAALQLGATALTQNVPNPLAGLLPGTALNGSTIALQQLLAPYPEFLINGITEQFKPVGKSSYNAGQFLVSKRLSYGLNFSAAYTISKQIDQVNYANPQILRLEKVIAAWDIPQNLQINFLYELPFGAGKPWGSNLAAPVRWAIGGWEVSTLTRLQAGMPLNLNPTGNSTEPIGINPAIPNQTLTQWFNTCTLLANGTTRGCTGNQQPAWTVRPPDVLQTWSTRLTSVRNPGIHNVDISVIKHNHLTERFDLLFRADFINAFNSPQFFSGPVTDVNNANFGRISGAMDQSNLPRFIQLSMKLQF